MTLSLYKFVVLGLSAAIGLSIFLFNLSWMEITAIADDVGVVKEDVAYIKGIVSTWPNDYNP